MKFKIVSDSASNIFELADIPYSNVPLKIISSQKEYVDTKELDVVNMVKELKNEKNKTGTSCPNSHEWMEAYGDADCVFAVTITSKLSGSYSAAMNAGENYKQEHPHANVCIIDTLSAGPEMQLLIEQLRELILEEKNFDEIKDAIHSYQKHTHLLFSLQSLTNLARNGRVHPAVAKMAGILGIRIVGKASEGTLMPLHKCRSEKKALRTILNEMKKEGYRGKAVRIAHCMNPESAKALKKMILAEFPTSDVQIESCAALCSYYAEQGGLMVGYADSKDE